MYETLLTIFCLLLVIGIFVWLRFLYHRVGRNYRKRKKDYDIKNITTKYEKNQINKKQLLINWLIIAWSIFIIAIIASFIPENFTWWDALGRIVITLIVVWKIIKWPLIIWLIGLRIYWLITKPKENLPYLIIGIVIGVISYFSFGTNNWTGFYYPNAIDTTDNPIVQEWFKSKSDCFDWIGTMIKWNDKEDYECGTNCKYEANFWVWRCKNAYDSF